MKKVSIGIVGSGFASELHAEAYKKIYGVEAVVSAVCSVSDDVYDFAEKYGISKIYRDYAEMLGDDEIEIVDIITPPHLHVDMIRKGLMAGKHVICEKPLTGYFGTQEELSADNVGQVSKAKMLEKVVEQMDSLKEIVKKGDKKLMYAENFVYAPTVQKAVEIIRKQKSKILFMKAEETHSGSHAPHAAYWKYNGGGSLIRQGCHPLSAVLYLKQEEAKARGEEIRLTSVVADVGCVTSSLDETDKRYIASRPVDVEDQANVIMTFSDGTKASVVAGDSILGGVHNLLELYTNKGCIIPNMAPNNAMQIYHVSEEDVKDIYVTEKVENKSGWQSVYVEEEVNRGYVGELQDFMECVAYDRAPKSDFDLAYETVRAIYAAYLSAEEGTRILL